MKSLKTFSFLALTVLAAPLLASSPALSIISPRGVQRGTEAVLTFSGARLSDAEEVFFYRPGVKATKIEPIEKNANAIRVTVQVAADCRPGEHIAQVLHEKWHLGIPHVFRRNASRDRRKGTQQRV